MRRTLISGYESKRRADDNSYKLEDTAYQDKALAKQKLEDKLAIEAMKAHHAIARKYVVRLKCKIQNHGRTEVHKLTSMTN